MGLHTVASWDILSQALELGGISLSWHLSLLQVGTEPRQDLPTVGWVSSDHSVCDLIPVYV